MLNNIVVCCCDFSPNDWAVLLIFKVLVLPLLIDATWEFLIPEFILICGLLRVLLRLFCVSDEVDCLGKSGANGKIWVGNYW